MDGMPVSAAGSRVLIEMSRAECVQRLAQAGFGRVAVGLGDGPPVIRPVNYAWDEASYSVVFRTLPGSKLHALTRAPRASFEIDAMDAATKTGWSVTLDGAVERVTSPAEIRRLERLGLDTWLGSRDAHWVRIRAGTVRGRRVAPAPLGPDPA